MENEAMSLVSTAGTSIAGVAAGGWLMRFFIGRQLKVYDDQFKALTEDNKELRKELAAMNQKLTEFMLSEARAGNGLVTKRDCEQCRQQCERHRDKDIDDLVDRIDRLTNQLEGLTGYLIARGEVANGGPLFQGG